MFDLFKLDQKKYINNKIDSFQFDQLVGLIILIYLGRAIRNVGFSQFRINLTYTHII